MIRRTLGEVRDGSGDFWGGLSRVGGPTLWSWKGRGSLREVRDGSGTLGVVRDGSGDPRGSLRRLCEP